MTDLRFIERDGKRILQYRPTASGQVALNWADVPLVQEATPQQSLAEQIADILYGTHTKLPMDKGVLISNLEWRLPAIRELLADAAPKPDADGWIEWKGGENPVPGKHVYWKTANGTAHTHPILSNTLRWTHYENGLDIVSFRIVNV